MILDSIYMGTLHSVPKQLSSLSVKGVHAHRLAMHIITTTIFQSEELNI